jgi:hypothetical protein
MQSGISWLADQSLTSFLEPCGQIELPGGYFSSGRASVISGRSVSPTRTGCVVSAVLSISAGVDWQLARRASRTEKKHG